MIAFFTEPVKSRKDATTSGIVSAYGFLLMENALELVAVLAGLHTNNEFFRHCLVSRNAYF